MGRLDLKPLSFKQLLAVPPPPMLVEGLVPQRGITLLTSDGGVGKTFLVMEMMRCMIMNQLLFGKLKVQRGCIAFFGQDDSILGYAQQARKVIKEDYLALEGDMTKEIEAGGTPVNAFDDLVKWFIQPGVVLDDMRHVNELIEAMNKIEHSYGAMTTENYQDDEGEWHEVQSGPYQYGPQLIVIDTFSSSKLGNEDSNTDMQVVMNNARIIADQCEAAVLFTHHLPKLNEFNSLTGRTPRGASAIRNSSDWHVQLTQSNMRNEIKLVVERARGIKIDPIMYIMPTDEATCRFHLSTNVSDTTTPTEGVDSEAAIEKALMEAQGMPIRAKDIIDLLKKQYPDLAHSTLETRWRRAIAHLVTRKIAEKAGYGQYKATADALANGAAKD
jgi:hypothetical protein